MSGYAIAQYTITNAEMYQHYVSVVRPTIDKHGGKILVANPESLFLPNSI